MEDLVNGSDFFRKAFPPTDYVCNSAGELIHFDGAYDVEKHRLSYERAKKWILKDGEWLSRPGMLQFRRLFSDQIDPADYQAFRARSVDLNFDLGTLGAPSREGWTKGLPPVCVGMLGKFKRKPAVVVARVVREEEELELVGIGDPECLFKDYESINRVQFFGSRVQSVRREFWKLATALGDVEVPVTSTMFYRSNRVVQNFEDRGLVRAFKYIVEPLTVGVECSAIAKRLETKHPLERIPRKGSKDSFKRRRCQNNN